MTTLNIINFDQFNYDEKILAQLKEDKADEILFQNLYDFRNKTANAPFHFLIGMCWLKKGRSHEAYIAFDKAQSVLGNNSYKGKLFQALALYYAQKDEEAKDMLGEIPTEELNVYEKLAFMSLSNSYNIDCSYLLDDILNTEFPTEADKSVMSVFAYVYSNKKNKANDVAISLLPSLFKSINDYVYVVGEFYKLHMRHFTIRKMLSLVLKFCLDNEVVAQDFMMVLKQINACCLQELVFDKKFEVLIKNKIKSAEDKKIKNLWWDSLVQLWAMELDYALANGKEYIHRKLMNKIRSLKYKNEQATLIIVTDSMSKVKDGKINLEHLKKKIEKLIEFDQHNIRYRKIYADFAIMIGHPSSAEEIANATIAMKKADESKTTELLRAFYNFYGHPICLFSANKNHIEAFNSLEDDFDGQKCPWCFNSGYSPIIRTIGFAHSPSRIFAGENIERARIEVDECTLHKMVDWQPMNVPSPLMSKYLHKLGAYMSPLEYPDVLVHGQTYVFIQLKTEAYKRLAAEGYSLSQIDPLWVATNMTGSERKELQIFSKTDKEVPVDCYPITAKDIVVDVIRC